jgi:hypothetical protein
MPHLFGQQLLMLLGLFVFGNIRGAPNDQERLSIAVAGEEDIAAQKPPPLAMGVSQPEIPS